MDKDRELDQLREKLLVLDTQLNARSLEIWHLQKNLELIKKSEEVAVNNLDKLLKERHNGTKISKQIRKAREMELLAKQYKEPKGPQGLQKKLAASFEATLKNLDTLNTQIQ